MAIFIALWYISRVKVGWRNKQSKFFMVFFFFCLVLFCLVNFWYWNQDTNNLYEQCFTIYYIYIYIWTCYHHHHIVPLARISLTLSHHFSLSFIASGRSSGLHSVSSHSCWMYVRAGRPAFARPYVGVHKSTSLMSSFLLLQKCPACLVRLTWIVFMIGGRWPYSWCLVGRCRQGLFKKNTFSKVDFIYSMNHFPTLNVSF